MSRISLRRTPATVLIAVVLVALAGCGRTSNDTSAATTHKPSASHSPSRSSQPSSPSPTPQLVTLPVYYVGDQPRGPKLFREFRSLEVPGSSDRVTAALNAALAGQALDLDYRSDWPSGTTVNPVAMSSSAYVVDLTNSGADLTTRPRNVTAAQASLALQQLVYTVQAVSQKRLPVLFRINGDPAQTVLGVPVRSVVKAEAPMKVQGTVWIIDPQEGDHVGPTFTVNGRGAFFEATVPWQLIQSDKVVKQGVAMAKECCTLSPYSFTVRNVRPGTYTLRVYDADASGVEGGRTEPEDTKHITVG